MASSENKRELILTRSPGRLMVSLSLPAIVGMVVIGLYTFVDAIYAGQLIGVDAMGAVSDRIPVRRSSTRAGGHDRHGLGLRAVAGHRARAIRRASTR